MIFIGVTMCLSAYVSVCVNRARKEYINNSNEENFQ